MYLVRPIFCKHEQKYIITATNGELVCGKCGVVVGQEDDSPTTINSTTNLFQDYSLGTKQTGEFHSEKFIQVSKPLNVISNICQALELPKYISQDIYRWNNVITKRIDMTKAKIIFLTIYVICRYNSIPLSEEKLGKIIATYLHVENTPQALKVISKSLSFLEDGVPILEKIGFTKFLKQNPIFYLYSELKLLHGKYPPGIIQSIRDIALEEFTKNNSLTQNCAKKSIKLAKNRCGVC